MSSGHKVDVHFLTEVCDHILSKYIAHSAGVGLPAACPFIRVWPEQIDQKWRVGRVDGSWNLTQLVPVLEIGWQSAMHAEDLSGDQGTEWETVEYILKYLKYLYYNFNKQ